MVRKVPISAASELKKLREAVEARDVLVNGLAMVDLVVTTITATSGQHLLVSGVTGKDIQFKLTDANGARKVSILDSADAEQFSVNSDGALAANVINTPILNDADTDALKIRGLISTRNAADNSMYIPVANTSSYERGMKVCYAPVVNDGGYFDALYANVKVASTSTPTGIIRALEAKATIEGDCGASAEAHAILAKLNASGASAEVSKAIGLDVLMEEESSGTLTLATGIRVQGPDTLNSEVIDIGIDLSGHYKQGALKLPTGTADSNGAPAAANAVTAFGTAANKAPSSTFAVIGGFKDSHSGGNLYLIVAYNGAYYAMDAGDALS